MSYHADVVSIQQNLFQLRRSAAVVASKGQSSPFLAEDLVRLLLGDILQDHVWDSISLKFAQPHKIFTH